MTSGLAQSVNVGPDGDGSPLDNAAAIRVPLGELALLTDSLARDPGVPVSFLAEFEGSDVYATLSASSARTVTIGSGNYIALTCQLTDVATAPGLSAGFALSELCSVIIPAPLHHGDGLGYLLPGQYQD